MNTQDSTPNSHEVQPNDLTAAQPNDLTETQPSSFTQRQTGGFIGGEPHSFTEAQPASFTQAQPGNFAATAHSLPTETASTLSSGQKLAPRTGPIVWGCLILAFCAYMLQRAIAPETVSGAVWITATLFGLGILLLGVGVAIVARNRRRQTADTNNRDR